MRVLSSTISACIIVAGLNLFITSTASGVLPPEVYERAVQSSAIKAIAIVEDVIVLEETSRSTFQKAIFRLEQSFHGDIPQKFTGLCNSVDHKWQYPVVGGTIYYYPRRGSRVFVTISSDGGSITSYTPMTSQMDEELKSNGLKHISFPAGRFLIKKKPLVDPILRMKKFYKARQYKKAFDILEPEALVGHDIAMNCLGHMYLNGIGVEINQEESSKWIKLAARQNLPEALDLLGLPEVQTNGGPNQAGNYIPGTRQLFDALYKNDLKTVKHLLNMGVNANAKNDTGQTPLHVTQDLAILKVLILNGANVNGVDDDGRTPIFNKDIDLLKILIENGADIHHKTKKGNTLVMWYSYSGYLEGIQYLISLGADVNAINKDGQTACDIAQRFAHFELLTYLKSVRRQKKGK